MTASLPSTTIPFPFVGGLSTRGDKRAKNPPALDICKDVEFDDFGGLRTRYPYANLGVNIFGGGTISNPRRLVANGDELLLFTKDTLYSWSSALSVWVAKGTHLAAKVTSQPRFVSTGDQVECDRAELNGIVVYAWREGTAVYAAAVDKATSAVVVSPTNVASGQSLCRPRLVALSTKIVLFVVNNTSINIEAIAIDPTSPATAIGGARTTLCAENTNYDAVRIGTTDYAALVVRQSPTTSYTVMRISSALAAAANATPARPCTGAIAVSSDPTGTYLQVLRYDSGTTNLLGDLLNATTLAAVYTAQVVAAASSAPAHLACAHRSVQNGGAYRCYAFWDYGFGAARTVKTNWVDTANTLGAESTFRVGYLGVASRAFDYDGAVYVHLAFEAASSGTDLEAELQNSYFLLRDDHFLVAKELPGNAAGFQATDNYLPGVATIGTGAYAWCGTERRIVPIGAGKSNGYSDRGPCDISITFDSNEARRGVRLGKTLYVAGGGEVLQYDGARLAELGFHWFPFAFSANDSGSGSGLDIGKYAYKATYRWENAQGETERSTTATIVTTDELAATNDVSIGDVYTLTLTHKTSNQPAIEFWRTAKTPTEDAPYYLISDNDPTNTSSTNGYIANDDTTAALYHASAYTDALNDTNATNHESNPENGGYLENIAPPPATLIAASDTRLFLAGVAGDPDRVWYSKQRQEGELAAFNDALTIDIPPAGGDITAITVSPDGTVIVFRETATYVLLNDGYDNAGGGQNYVARESSPRVGAVNQECIAVTDDGVLFKSSKGWHVLNRAFQVNYIGAPVYAYDSETPLAAHVVPGQHQVRILTSSRMLVWDFLVNQWGEWSTSSGLDATVWNDQHVYLTSSGPKAQLSTYTGVDYGYDVETTWIKTTNDLQGRAIVRMFEVLGEFRAASSVRVRCARNYESDGAGGWSYNYDKTWVVTPTVVGGPLQLKVAPTVKRPIQAFKVRLTAMHADGVSAPSGDTSKLTGIAIDVAIENGLYSGPAAQKQ